MKIQEKVLKKVLETTATLEGYKQHITETAISLTLAEVEKIIDEHEIDKHTTTYDLIKELKQKLKGEEK